MTARTSNHQDTSVAAALEGLGEGRAFDPGETLLAYGGPGDGLYVVDEGIVKLVVPGSGARSVLLAVRGPGDVAGETGALDGRGRSAAVVALTAVRARWIPRDVLLRVLEQDPAASALLLDVVLARLRDATGVVEGC